MAKQYDIGQLVLFEERISDTALLPIVGWIVNKYFDEDNLLMYTIEWADGFCDNFYRQSEVDAYVTTLKRYARSLHK